MCRTHIIQNSPKQGLSFQQAIQIRVTSNIKLIYVLLWLHPLSSFTFFCDCMNLWKAEKWRFYCHTIRLLPFVSLGLFYRLQSKGISFFKRCPWFKPPLYRSSRSCNPLINYGHGLICLKIKANWVSFVFQVNSTKWITKEISRFHTASVVLNLK